MDNSIIIPTLGHIDGLRSCIHSVAMSTDLDRTEVIVVANGSPPETIDYLDKLPEPFRYIMHPEPLGFARAINAGVTIARGKRVVLLNDDAIILGWGRGDAWIKILEDPFQDPSMAATGAAIDHWAKGMPFLVMFCTMIDRAKMFELGLLDEAFGMGGGEDCDFCLKAIQKGWGIRQVPIELPKWDSQFPVWHVGHITCGGLPEFPQNADKNTQLLEERYPRTEEDREYQREFSKGTINAPLAY
jgi:GT2 family glycosyltransferase